METEQTTTRALGERTIPIPCFRMVARVEDNVGALRHGPLAPGQMSEIDELLGRAGAAV